MAGICPLQKLVGHTYLIGAMFKHFLCLPMMLTFIYLSAQLFVRTDGVRIYLFVCTIACFEMLLWYVAFVYDLRTIACLYKCLLCELFVQLFFSHMSFSHTIGCWCIGCAIVCPCKGCSRIGIALQTYLFCELLV